MELRRQSPAEIRRIEAIIAVHHRKIVYGWFNRNDRGFRESLRKSKRCGPDVASCIDDEIILQGASRFDGSIKLSGQA